MTSSAHRTPPPPGHINEPRSALYRDSHGVTCEEDRLTLCSQSGETRLCNDRRGNASHFTNELYVGMARLDVHLGPGRSASSSAAASPGRSLDKGGWGVAVGEE